MGGEQSPPLPRSRFSSLSQARVVLASWQEDYNDVRPHSGLANRTPQEFRNQHITLAGSPATVRTSTQDRKSSSAQFEQKRPPHEHDALGL
jgi:putative transposase